MNNAGERLAPVVVFAFNRPSHTRRTLQALASNPEISETPVFVYCDGAREARDDARVDATRKVVREAGLPRLKIIESRENRGLAASVIRGVTETCKSFGRVVVLEDDLVVSPTFLCFMNHALERYRDEERVMQVSGHMFPVPLRGRECIFLPFTTSWGWGTWYRAWRKLEAPAPTYAVLRRDRRLRRSFDLDGAYPYSRMLRKQMAGQIDSWAIRWYLSVFVRGGLTLYPPKTLVTNIGFDGSGTNCETTLWDDQPEGSIGATAFPRAAAFPTPDISQDVLAQVQEFLRKRYSARARAWRTLTSLLSKKFGDKLNVH